MFKPIAERRMHQIRWVLTSGWVLLTLSLLYDPISPLLTRPDNAFSPFRFDPNACVRVQGSCLDLQPYPLGTTIFWGMVVPSSIFILLVFGHELWRRICPLSFLSQIPRALGWQRQWKRVNEKTGKVRFELAKIKPDSWLGKNYLWLQFSLLYVGLCARILFINSNRWALFAWLTLTIGAAIAVGYLYGGKSWCNYFCPMAPVQKIYSEPKGLLGSAAHTADQQITQSMCRVVDNEGKEQSACVACQNPCIDIDSERSYWENISKPEQKFLYYGYVGLVIGYFLYYYLYAGNWEYYFSGVWAHQANQLETLFDPGFYLFNNPVPIPKLVAVPLTLAVFIGAFYGIGRIFEQRYQSYLERTKSSLHPDLIQHRMFSLCTFFIFNFFFIFAGRPLILLMPLSLQFLYEAALIGLSTLWLYHTWQRSPDRYARESLASRLRRQLGRLELDLSQFIEGRSLEDLSTDEVYVLAKVLPGFTKEKRYQAYKGVLREALEEGYVNTSSSLAVLQQIRAELDISEDEHRRVLEEVGVEDPDLLDPNRQRSRENLVRLNGYRKALERMVSLQQRGISTGGAQGLLRNEANVLQALRREYSVTLQEETQIIETLDPTAQLSRRADFLLQQLSSLIERYQVLNQPYLRDQKAALVLLRSAVKRKKYLLVTGLLEIIEQAGSTLTLAGESTPLAAKIARSLDELSPTVLIEMLEASALNPEDPTCWHRRLDPQMIQQWMNPNQNAKSCSLELDSATISTHLEALSTDPNPLIQATSLYLLYQNDRGRGQKLAQQTLAAKPNPLSRDVATIIQADAPLSLPLSAFKNLEKLVYLSNSDFFGGIQSETLIQLAERAVVKPYNQDELVTEAGDTCRELLLLIEGIVEVRHDLENGETRIESLLPGYVLDELEVLSHSESTSTIISKAPRTRILALPVDALDDLFDRDHDFARRVLELESRRLQQLIR